MIYIYYELCYEGNVQFNKENVSISKKVIEGDSFEIVELKLPAKEKSSNYNHDLTINQNVTFTIKTDKNVYEKISINTGYIEMNKRDYYNNTNTDEIYPYLQWFGIASSKENVCFKPKINPLYKKGSNVQYIYANEQLLQWLKEKTQYIDTIFEKIDKIQEKKRELEKDFDNYSATVFKTRRYTKKH